MAAKLAAELESRTRLRSEIATASLGTGVIGDAGYRGWQAGLGW